MPFADDLRYAARRLSQRPGFALTALATLAVAIGFNAVVFNFANFFLLRPLPIADPERVVTLEFRGDPSVSYRDYETIRDRNQVFSGVAAIRTIPMGLAGGGTSALAWGYLVSGNYFSVLGIAPWRGRLLAPTDDVKTGAHPVAVLSFGCWQRRFGADPNAVGRTVRINGHPFTIVGITPPGFIGTERIYTAEIWVTLSMVREIEGWDWRTPDNRNALTVARLKPGTDARQAEASLAVLAAQMAREQPSRNEGLTIRLVPTGLFGSALRGPTIGFAAALLLVAALTLLAACTNLSGLLLAHAAGRRKEIAIRLAIGAGRGNIVRLMLVESLLLAAGGGALGLLLSLWLRDSLFALLALRDLPIQLAVNPDWRVFAFSAAVSLATAFLFGLLPALRASRLDLTPALKNEPAGAFRHWHLREFYAAIQVALSVVLLAGSVMMVRSMRRALSMNLGFRPDHAVTLHADLQMQGYSEERGRAFQQRLFDRLQALPGLDAVGVANSVPFSIDRSRSSVLVEGRPVPKPGEESQAITFQCSPGFFRALGTRLLAGRDFDQRDRQGTPPVVIVNETLARRLFPHEQPLGKQIRFGSAGVWAQIVGVAESGKYESLTENPQMAVWRPLAQDYSSGVTVVARTNHPPQDVLKTLQQTVVALDPDIAVFGAGTLDEYLNLPLAPVKLATAALAAMGLVAALLCALGLYGLLAYTTAQRTREIGIRVALGATGRDILAAIGRRTAALAGVGGLVGLVLAWLFTRLLANLLFGAVDAAVLALALLLLGVVAVLASFLPMRRALRIQPSAALQCERTRTLTQRQVCYDSWFTARGARAPRAPQA
jgi:predicted permease